MSLRQDGAPPEWSSLCRTLWSWCCSLSGCSRCCSSVNSSVFEGIPRSDPRWCGLEAVNSVHRRRVDIKGGHNSLCVRYHLLSLADVQEEIVSLTLVSQVLSDRHFPCFQWSGHCSRVVSKLDGGFGVNIIQYNTEKKVFNNQHLTENVLFVRNQNKLLFKAFVLMLDLTTWWDLWDLSIPSDLFCASKLTNLVRGIHHHCRCAANRSPDS